MAPLYMERERRKRRREGEMGRLEVPREFGAGVGVGRVGDGVSGAGGMVGGEAEVKGAGGKGGEGEVKGKGGMVDRSRDPRLNRG